MRKDTGFAATALLAFAAGVHGAPVQTAAALVDLTLEQLSNIAVTSVSGRAEPLSRAPGSIYVITGEDIRRSGATTLPEALRLAPNLHVAQVDAWQYAISARGNNSTTANKLQVLIDGRTVYTPLFSGTFWDAQDVLLEDVERIEVVSGPGGTLWGANAVNGVINVITRRAGDTQGGALGTAHAGNLERGAAARYGGAMAGGHYRLYAKGRDRDASRFESGGSARDANDLYQAGFRADWGERLDGFTLQGDAYGGDLDQGRSRSGFNLLGRWTRPLAGGGSLRVQGYLDNTYRDYPGTFEEDLDTYDLDVQHALAPTGRHRVIWGFGVRYHRDRVTNSAVLAFLPAHTDFNRSNVFVQDEIALRPDLDLTVGAKLDRNTYTGVEFLPSVRLAWRLSESRLLWTALSRAVRAPSRIDRELFAPPAPPFVLLAGGPEFRSEVAKVLELGYRAQPGARLSYSLTGYYHRYDGLRSQAPSPEGPVLRNDLEGETTGIEGWGTWRPADWWRLSAGFVKQHQSIRLRPGGVNTLAPGANGNDPSGWLNLRAAFDLSPAHDLDILVRRVGALPSPEVPAYTAVDARLGWKPRRGLEVALAAQNLLDRRHAEWASAAGSVEIERSVYVQLRVGL